MTISEPSLAAYTYYQVAILSKDWLIFCKWNDQDMMKRFEVVYKEAWLGKWAVK
jgi:hypothetical protein